MNIRRRYDEPDTPLLLLRYIDDNEAAALMNDFYFHLLTLAGTQAGTEATEF